jgi:carboxypeptidase Taq
MVKTFFTMSGGQAMRAEAAYEELIRRVRESALLDSCAVLLGWDEETYLPPAGAEHRGNQMALLAGLHHARITDPAIGDLLAAVEDSPLIAEPLAPAAVNVGEIRWTYDRARRLPRALVEELARATTLAQHAWAIAREHARYAVFRPWLEKIVHLKRAEAESLGFEGSAYDALLENHERGARSAELEKLFDSLRVDLVPLANAITHARRRPTASVLRRHYPLDRQRLFAEAAAAAVGFDFRRGRLDATRHPFFSNVGPGDCRLTTRYRADCFSDAFFGVLHEVGHGLYEQGLDPAHHGTPMGEAPSLATHESQARLWENLVGRCLPFWRHFFPRARQVFPDALRDVTLEDFYFAVNHVEPTLIRVGADEVTYNLHVLIRFDLEKALLAGDLLVADVPLAWHQAYRHFLGTVPENDAEGCLQDSHWAAGLFGYFPTYTLGNLFAAQLFARSCSEIVDLDGQMERGDFSGLLSWLRERVYRHGSRFPAARLIELAAGAAPDHKPFIEALRRKYSELYEL